MTIASARQYVESLKVRVSRCASIDPEDRLTLPCRFDETKRVGVIVRGFDAAEQLFGDDPTVSVPFRLVFGGRLSLHVRVREMPTRRTQRPAIEVAAYRFSLLDVPNNPNSVRSLRFDKPDGQPRGTGWDEELQDNPEHPHAHVHLNFLDDNDCRLPTASVCPLLLLSALDYWYYTMFRP